MLDGFRTWLGKPFDAGQDWFHWFLFIGLLLVIFWAWKMILAHILS